MHYFCDHKNINSETQAYGPDVSSLTTVYNTSISFSLTNDAKAFACQTGQIIVVKHATKPNEMVNVILRCRDDLSKIGLSRAKYYIYRGIKRDSFFSGSSFVASHSSNSQVVKAMWEDHVAHKAVDATLPNLAPCDVGYEEIVAGSSTLQDTTMLDAIFSSSLSTANSSTPSNQTIRPRDVNEGDWIGDFHKDTTTSVAFEVIVEEQLLTLDIAYAQQAQSQITIPASYSGSAAVQSHAERNDRERCLAFLDPCALFGMFNNVKALDDAAGAGPLDKRTYPVDDIFNKLLNKFSTKNTVYVDVRSELGYSYNYYGNYGLAVGSGTNTHQISYEIASATAVEKAYDTNNWPILILPPQASSSGKTYKLNLKLRINDNTKPLLYIPQSKLRRPKKNIASEARLLPGSGDWTKEIKFRLGNYDDTSNTKKTKATYLRLQYFRQKDGVSAAPSQFDYYLDTAFGGIDLIRPGLMENGAAFGHIRNEKLRLSEGNFGPKDLYSNVMESGVYFDDDMALFYSRATVALRTGTKSYPKLNSNTKAFKNRLLIRSDVFPKKVLFNRWEVTKSGVKISIIDLSGYANSSKNTQKYGAFFLGITRTELTLLLSLAPFDDSHEKSVVLVKSDELDDNSIPYKKYEVKLQGLKADGTRSLVSASPQIWVYGSGSDMVCSPAFSHLSGLNLRIPDPGVMKSWENAYAGSYDETSSNVLSLFPTGNAQIFDQYNDKKNRNPFTNIRAEYFFPMDQADRDFPAGTPLIGKISSRNTNYPLAIIVHGNGQDYREYNDLGMHLARNGFIVASINCKFIHGLKKMEGGMGGPGRTEIIFKHLSVLNGLFGSKLKNEIGLIGHSRGGEAVVRAAKTISTASVPANLNTIKAIVSLAPTDRYEPENLTQNIPYYVLYGSRDTDVSGLVALGAKSYLRLDRTTLLGSGAFSLYDRAINTSLKSMSFVYGANHNGFITNSGRDPNIIVSGVIKSHIATVTDTTQQHISKGYINAFLRYSVFGEAMWKPIFTGEIVPLSTGYEKIYQQFQDMSNRHILDNFEFNHNSTTTSSSGFPVTPVTTSQNEGYLNPHSIPLRNILGQTSIDQFSPHETRGALISWKGGNTITFNVASTSLDVSPFTHFSFRICRSKLNPGDSLVDLQIEISDNSGGSPFSKKVELDIPKPEQRPDRPSGVDVTKSSLMTIRTALSEYSSNGVDLTKVEKVKFIFPASGSGSIEIDDLEFTS